MGGRGLAVLRLGLEFQGDPLGAGLERQGERQGMAAVDHLPDAAAQTGLGAGGDQLDGVVQPRRDDRRAVEPVQLRELAGRQVPLDAQELLNVVEEPLRGGDPQRGGRDPHRAQPRHLLGRVPLLTGLHGGPGRARLARHPHVEVLRQADRFGLAAVGADQDHLEVDLCIHYQVRVDGEDAADVVRLDARVEGPVAGVLVAAPGGRRGRGLTGDRAAEGPGDAQRVGDGVGVGGSDTVEHLDVQGGRGIHRRGPLVQAAQRRLRQQVAQRVAVAVGQHR